jgi:aminoglycoside 3-N-acetyltransferase
VEKSLDKSECDMPAAPQNAITYRDLSRGLRQLDLPPSAAVIAHASLSAFGQVSGGAAALLGAVLSCVDTLMMPAFTFKTKVIPESGPEDNGLVYGSGKDTNRMAEFYTLKMSADRLMGAVPETLRRMPAARRSSHPILSFTGINATAALQAQTMQEPLAPVGFLAEMEGWVLLLGVDHTVNTSIHYAEKLGGRKQFVRWALTPTGIKECPGYPGCSDGFQAISPSLDRITHRTAVGPAVVQAFPLQGLISVVQSMLADDPQALLCNNPECLRCSAVRKSLGEYGTGSQASNR